MTRAKLKSEAIELLQELIATPSLSREEERTATILFDYLGGEAAGVKRLGNNVWCFHADHDKKRPTVLLNSHHDTVPPSESWTRDPWQPAIEGGRLYGLGSNDAGASLVSLMAAFRHFQGSASLPFNLVYAATAEEEVSGRNGVASILDQLGPLFVGIVGEPTEMALAVAEKGLMVLDCTAHGKSGHAARNTGVNAIEGAIEAITWFHSYRFPRESALLGPVKMTTTIIAAGSRHNVLPDRCTFTVDVRTTDAYRNEEVLQEIRKHVSCDVAPRSTRLQPSRLEESHPLAIAAGKIGLKKVGSPTTSDQAVIPWPTAKIGPGRSERSHTGDEYVDLSEIERGIDIYIELLEALF